MKCFQFTKKMISDPPEKKSGNILPDPVAFHIVMVNYNQVITMAVFRAMVCLYIHVCTYPHKFMCFARYCRVTNSDGSYKCQSVVGCKHKRS